MGVSAMNWMELIQDRRKQEISLGGKSERNVQKNLGVDGSQCDEFDGVNSGQKKIGNISRR